MRQSDREEIRRRVVWSQDPEILADRRPSCAGGGGSPSAAWASMQESMHARRHLSFMEFSLPTLQKTAS